MTELRLTALRPEDRSRVSELVMSTAAFSPEEVSVALELFDERYGAAGQPEGHYEFVGAFGDDGLLLGYACFGPTPATEGTFDLYWLAVDPAAQRRGVGRALLHWVEHELELRRARLLVVETSSRADYSHTRAFYGRAGYIEAARLRDFYAPADDRIILTTRLTPRKRGVATR